MKKRAVITGITGQDGSYLTEYLLGQDYEVFGLVRRNSVTENQQNRIEHLADKITLVYGDMADVSSIDKIISMAQPHEFYNLAAQSHVRISFDIPQYTVQTNAIGVVNVLEAIRKLDYPVKLYQASSSEMFGNCVDADFYQSEKTPMRPVSPYGCSKLFAFSMTRNYRQAYKMFAANGILFNHESPRRASNFVTSKIVKNAVLIALGQADTLELGNLDSKRDWGHSKDYVRAMHMILQHHTADDFVVATGDAHTVREFCEITFNKLGLNYKDHVVQNPKFMRPEELNYLRGDSTKIRNLLGWKPEISFEQLIDEMIAHWQAELANG